MNGAAPTAPPIRPSPRGGSAHQQVCGAAPLSRPQPADGLLLLNDLHNRPRETAQRVQLISRRGQRAAAEPYCWKLAARRWPGSRERVRNGRATYAGLRRLPADTAPVRNSDRSERDRATVDSDDDPDRVAKGSRDVGDRGDRDIADAIADRPAAQSLKRCDDRRLIDAATRAVDASLSLTSGAAVSPSWSLCFDREIRPGSLDPLVAASGSHP